MEKQKVYSMTNGFGKKFLDRCFKNVLIDGTEKKTNDLRHEFFIIYRTEYGKYVAVLPDKDSPDDGSCFFGPLDYFAKVFAYGETGMKARWDVSGNPVHPKWFLNRDDPKLTEWNGIYRGILQKYAR